MKVEINGSKKVLKLTNPIFITGVAGFIGSNLAKRLLATFSETDIVGLDNMNDYYDVRLKEYRLKELMKYEREILRTKILSIVFSNSISPRLS